MTGVLPLSEYNIWINHGVKCSEKMAIYFRVLNLPKPWSVISMACLYLWRDHLRQWHLFIIYPQIYTGNVAAFLTSNFSLFIVKNIVAMSLHIWLTPFRYRQKYPGNGAAFLTFTFSLFIVKNILAMLLHFWRSPFRYLSSKISWQCSCTFDVHLFVIYRKKYPGNVASFLTSISFVICPQKYSCPEKTYWDLAGLSTSSNHAIICAGNGPEVILLIILFV